MALAKRTYTLPPQVVGDFEQAVPSGRRSALVTELMREWLEKRRREELRKSIVSGCQEMADEYRRIEEEYHPLEEEVERELNHVAPR
jgi:Arc/MetJ-type ribon-helix-helix transcriptional regulator